jgi:hypothetical protein
MRYLVPGLVTLIALLLSLDAGAARSGRDRWVGGRRAPQSSRLTDQRISPDLRPPSDGIIHWNTPNADGNLGGPSTGGGGGGGG